jgi:AAA family ATP:ADP antiporter
MAQNVAEAEAGARSQTHAVFAAASIGVSAAFLLCGYELVRSSSNTLYTEAYGAERLPAIMALSLPGLLAILYVYGRLLSWLGPSRTLLVTSLASGIAIASCYGAILTGSRVATGVLFVVREAYVVLLIEQYWSFLNSTLGTDAAKKLNGPICGVASLGAMLGGYLLGVLSKPVGTEHMLALGAVLCVPAALLSEIAYQRCGEPIREEIADDRGTASPHASHLGLALFRSHRMLVFLLLAVVATQVLSTMVDLNFQTTLKNAIPAKDERNAYSGNFYFALNAASACGQFVLAPLLLRFLPLRVVHLLPPLLNIGACSWLLGAPSLASAGTAYLLFKALDYSVFRAAKEILYVPFSFDVRYRAKELIDVFGYRFGKGAPSLAIALLQGAKVAFTSPVYAVTAIAAACVWLLVIVPVVSAYRHVHLHGNTFKHS